MAHAAAADVGYSPTGITPSKQPGWRLRRSSWTRRPHSRRSWPQNLPAEPGKGGRDRPARLHDGRRTLQRPCPTPYPGVPMPGGLRRHQDSRRGRRSALRSSTAKPTCRRALARIEEYRRAQSHEAIPPAHGAPAWVRPAGTPGFRLRALNNRHHHGSCVARLPGCIAYRGPFAIGCLLHGSPAVRAHLASSAALTFPDAVDVELLEKHRGETPGVEVRAMSMRIPPLRWGDARRTKNTEPTWRSSRNADVIGIQALPSSGRFVSQFGFPAAGAGTAFMRTCWHARYRAMGATTSRSVYSTRALDSLGCARSAPRQPA